MVHSAVWSFTEQPYLTGTLKSEHWVAEIDLARLLRWSQIIIGFAPKKNNIIMYFTIVNAISYTTKLAVLSSLSGRLHPNNYLPHLACSKLPEDLFMAMKICMFELHHDYWSTWTYQWPNVGYECPLLAPRCPSSQKSNFTKKLASKSLVRVWITHLNRSQMLTKMRVSSAKHIL